MCISLCMCVCVSVHILHSSAHQKALSSDSYQHFQAFWRNYRTDQLHLPVEEAQTKKEPEVKKEEEMRRNKPHPHEGRNL